MGKILVIKGADFSQVAVNKIPLISEFDTYLTHMWNLTSDLKDSKGNSTFSDGEITENGVKIISSDVQSIATISENTTTGVTLAMKINPTLASNSPDNYGGKIMYAQLFNVTEAENEESSVYSSYYSSSPAPVAICSGDTGINTDIFILSAGISTKYQLGTKNLNENNIIILSLSGNTIKVCVNGIVKTLSLTTDYWMKTYDRISLGSGWLSIDVNATRRDVRLYNKALTESEMITLYNEMNV